MTEIEEQANKLKKFYQDELNIHRKNGNYKYEITPSMIKEAFLLGAKYNS